MTKKERNQMEEEQRYEGFIEEYEGLSMSVLVDKLNALDRTPGADMIEMQAIKELLSKMDSEVDPYAE